jgi:hypothetical protein
MTGEPNEAAVRAAAQAVYGETSDYYLSLTRKWLAAALPHLTDEAVRASIADEIAYQIVQQADWLRSEGRDARRGNVWRDVARFVREMCQ